MKKLYSLVFSVTVTAAMAAAGVTPALLNLVMPDATVVSGMNVVAEHHLALRTIYFVSNAIER